jgi:UDP-3-O-[3-hydroxymyristoyl] N-acetylglucosamine deacetylase
MRSPSITKSFVELSGVGLHSGIETTVRLIPESAGCGRYFVRTDLPNQPIIPAQVACVTETKLSTRLSHENADVRTVEHLLAALTGMGVENARIEIDGAEVPLIDGSALPWVESISKSGLFEREGNSINPSVIYEPIWVRQDDAFVAAIPASTTCYTYGIDFDLEAIGKQWFTFCPKKGDFALEIAPARTFGLAPQIEALRSAGLIKGGSLENALVCDTNGWLNPPLRFPDEPVRHKLLDLIGDLSLVGNIPQAHYIAYKASHNLHVQLAQKLCRE